MKPRELERALTDAGFRLVRNGPKHKIWEHPSGRRTVTSHGLKKSFRCEPATRSLLRKLEAVR